MAFRSDHEAAVFRVDSLEAELERERERSQALADEVDALRNPRPMRAVRPRVEPRPPAPSPMQRTRHVEELVFSFALLGFLCWVTLAWLT